MPTQAEDADINAGIVQNSETYALNVAEFKQLCRGRPSSSDTKTQVTLRLNADVLENTGLSGAACKLATSEVAPSL